MNRKTNTFKSRPFNLCVKAALCALTTAWLPCHQSTARAEAGALRSGKEGERALPNSFFSTTGKVEKTGSGAAELPYLSAGEKMRMRAFEKDPRSIFLRFRYLGTTTKVAALRSGKVRSQFGVFLNAENQCNTLYAMWHVKSSEIVVQQKSNSGKSTHAECLNNGYQNIRPETHVALPELQTNKIHTLEARVSSDDRLEVKVDQKVVWEGKVPKQRKGPGFLGVRTDNVKIAFEVQGLSGGLEDDR